ncbi:MAG TPA: hypothetical protein VHO48_15770 [Anaerolineaceae bacterium]|nr:hypothetical protein [Anaerolineaceae bacterium]
MGWLIGAVLGIFFFFIWKAILPSSPELPAIPTQSAIISTPTHTLQPTTTKRISTQRATATASAPIHTPTRTVSLPTATSMPTEDPDFLAPLDSATSRVFSSYDEDSDFNRLIAEHAVNLSIIGPYRWQLYVVPDETRYADVRDYYRDALSEKGFHMTYDFQDERDIYLFKMAKDEKRVAVQFWAKQPETAPAVMVIYFSGP